MNVGYVHQVVPLGESGQIACDLVERGTQDYSSAFGKVRFPPFVRSADISPSGGNNAYLTSISTDYC